MDTAHRGAPVAPAGFSLRKNIAYATIGNGVLNLGRLAVVALLAKFASTEIQGVFTSTTIALATPVTLFFGLELRAAFVADARGEFTFGAYRALRSLGMGVAALALLATVLWITRAEANPALVWLMLAVCAGRVIFHQAEVYWGVYQRRERLDRLAWSNSLRGLTMLAPFAILFLVPAFHGRGAPPEPAWGRPLLIAAGAASTYAVAWLAVFWFFDRRHVVGHSDVDLSWKWAELGKLAKQTLPLGLVLLLINLCETVTQWFIKRAGGADGWAELGFFGAMRLITLAAMFFLVQVTTAAGNRLAITYQFDRPAFVRLAVRLTGVALVLGAGFWGLVWMHGEWILRVFYTPEYAGYYPEFLILTSAEAVVLLAVVFGSVTTHMRQFWIQVPVQVSVLVLTTISAWMLIDPANPVRGGAWTMLVRAVAQAVLYFGCVLIGLRWRDRIIAR